MIPQQGTADAELIQLELDCADEILQKLDSLTLGAPARAEIADIVTSLLQWPTAVALDHDVLAAKCPYASPTPTQTPMGQAPASWRELVAAAGEAARIHAVPVRDPGLKLW